MRRTNTYQLLSCGASLCFTLGALAAEAMGGPWGAALLLVLLVCGFFLHRMIYQLGRFESAEAIREEIQDIKEQREHGEQ